MTQTMSKGTPNMSIYLSTTMPMIHKSDLDLSDTVYWSYSDALSIIMVIFNFISLLTNIIVFILIASNRFLQTSTNALIGSLSTADLIYAALMIPYYILNILRTEEPVCIIDSTIPVFCSLASSWSLFAISPDRYLTLVRPLKYRLLMGKQAVIVMIIIVWCTSISIALGAFIPSFRSDKMYVYQCANYIYARTNYFIAYAFFMLLSIFGNMILYICIIRIAREALRKESITKVRSHGSINSAKRLPKRNFSRVGATAKSTRLCFCIAMMFMLVWLPMSIMTLVYSFCKECRMHEIHYLQKATGCLYAIALFMNPWIYFKNAGFPESTKKAVMY